MDTKAGLEPLEKYKILQRIALDYASAWMRKRDQRLGFSQGFIPQKGRW